MFERARMIGAFDIDGRNVVSKKDQFVRVEFLPILARQVLVPDEARLQQPHDKRAGSCEGVEDLDALVTQIRPKMVLEHPIDAVENEIHDLDGRVNNS